MNGPWLRLLRLACVAALRRAGMLPWMLLLVGVAWSTLLEPVMLRRSGLPLIESTAHGLAVLALLPIASGCSSLPQLRDRLAVSGLVTFGMALVQAGMAAAFPRFRARHQTQRPFQPICESVFLVISTPT